MCSEFFSCLICFSFAGSSFWVIRELLWRKVFLEMSYFYGFLACVLIYQVVFDTKFPLTRVTLEWFSWTVCVHMWHSRRIFLAKLLSHKSQRSLLFCLTTFVELSRENNSTRQYGWLGNFVLVSDWVWVCPLRTSAKREGVRGTKIHTDVYEEVDLQPQWTSAFKSHTHSE